MGARIVKRRGGLEEEYYEWLIDMIPRLRDRYSNLLWQLYTTPFRSQIEMDRNREGDGMSLRSRYIWENRMSAYEREELKSIRPCSVLEVMIALALRCEEEYMTKFDDEDPVGIWFVPMLESMGIIRYENRNYDPAAVDAAVQKMMNRDYAPDGRGGLFHIPNVPDDMRQIEIWYQAMWWLETYIERGGKIYE